MDGQQGRRTGSAGARRADLPAALREDRAFRMIAEGHTIR